MLALTDVALVVQPDEPVPYSAGGYIIDDNGVTYVLLRRMWHGVVLAALYPNVAEAEGYSLPDDIEDINVLHFQEFELDHHELFPVIRICPSRLNGRMSIDRYSRPATKSQIDAVYQVFKATGHQAHDKVTVECGQIKVCDVGDYLKHETVRVVYEDDDYDF